MRDRPPTGRLDSAFDPTYASRTANIASAMKPSRSTRFLTAIVALFSMLYMQLAVASYVCPGVPVDGQDRAVPAQTAMSDMPDCQDMDAAQPQLCHLHANGEPAKQSLDLPAADVPPFMPSALVLELKLADAVLIPDAASFRPIALARVTAPPVAIRNCCFRI